jgi:nicotinamidase/pyrazinamidase
MNALLIVDIQNDFLPGGALAVPEGDQVIPVINKLVASEGFDLIIATQDWHPENHRSFASNHVQKNPGEVIDLNGLKQVLWPDHCIQGTAGAEFSQQLQMDKVEAIFRKGMDPEIDSYSGFYDNGHRKNTGLTGYLKERTVEKLFVCGLAADYCVKFTVLDALKEGFETVLFEDATRAVNLQKGDLENALAEMKSAGCVVLDSSEVLAE